AECGAGSLALGFWSSE
ncbi:hypothetical protein A2U01_0050394, partial [Trifolium medium]|nr:hypothetical protein [Trifolium medium]